MARGAPKGRIGNPTGKNQYVDAAGQGTRQEMIGFRGPSGLKAQIQKAASSQGMSVSEWILEVVETKLKEMTVNQ